MSRLVPSLLTALTAALVGCSSDAPVDVLKLSGPDTQVAVAVGGHVPAHQYTLRATLQSPVRPGPPPSATITALSEFADLVGAVTGGWLEDLDRDGDDDVVVMQLNRAYDLHVLDVWMREPASLRRVTLAPIPVELRPAGELRETVRVTDGRLVRRLRSVESGAVTPIAYDFTAETWTPFGGD